MNDPLSLLSDLIAQARKAGADAADAVFISGTSLSVSRRLGKTEHVERSEGQDLGLRVFLGQRAAIVSSTTIDPGAFAGLAERAVAMAKVVPEDPYTGLADTAAPPEPVDLDMVDGTVPTAEMLVERAAAAEDAARSVAGITNSEGADAGYGRSELTLVTSAGFAGRRAGTSHSVSATAIAGSGTDMQRDYDYHSTVHLTDLDDPVVIGRRAGDRAVARLHPARPKTARIPVVYDPRVAGGLLGHLSGAINGSAVARGTSFLKDRMGQRIFAAGIAIHDDPRRVRGLRSRIFDAEGTPTRPHALIQDGVLTTWLLDSRAARQLGLRSTGHAARGIGGPPSPSATNLYLAPGTVTPAELMADIKLGLYVTELIGMGVNGVTGDYSRGAAGFMIRDGVLAEPVAEITIAGNLLAMFASLTPANDLTFRRGTDSPTVRIDGMTMAGA
ncbi:TldD/PmbA family protein [Rhodopila sp.]|jgi:PmbA protein|uniref:TldD/PmbA family protein n=1 Tax=Rhodopila sp. TaxID=2480087 RepID=UPI002CC975B9|nr:TldD/PmbA family protein [Rhodopila sp.]HVZ08667.1 TldD/PmbA family protein [Rhodopila sp.]